MTFAFIRSQSTTLRDSIRILAVGVVLGCLAEQPLLGEEPPGSSLSTALSPEEALQVESAVDRGLDWLSTQQNKDGSFKGTDDGQPSATCYAVLAYLSRGHQPGQGEYGRQMFAAIDYVLSKQREDGSFASYHEGPANLRNHPTSGLMLSEVYGSTVGRRAEKIRSAVKRALAFSRRAQTDAAKPEVEYGGWRYHDPPNYNVGPNDILNKFGRSWGGPHSCFPTTCSELIFLRSAANAGFRVPQEWIDDGLKYVRSCYIERRDRQVTGVFNWRHNFPTRSTYLRTGAGALTLQLHGRRDDPMVDDCLVWLRKHPIALDHEYHPFYRSLYYSGQAMAQAGGDNWNHFFPPLARRLLQDQTSDGYWLETQETIDNFGTCFRTSLAVLTLTLPDQLLPIHQR